MQDVPMAKRAKLEATTPPSQSEEIETRMTESRAGITAYIDPTLPGFQGIIKQRFTDFMVNEIDLAGNVCRLTSLDPPAGKYLSQLRPDQSASTAKEAVQATAEETAAAQAKAKLDEGAWPTDAETKLLEFFAEDKVEALKEMWSKGRAGENMGTGANATLVSANSVVTRPLESKEERTQVHKLIRELFAGKLATDSVTIRVRGAKQAEEDEDARANGAAAVSGPATAIAVRWANKSDRRTGDDLSEEAASSPPYIHFLLQKTNRDHQEAMVCSLKV